MSDQACIGCDIGSLTKAVIARAADLQDAAQSFERNGLLVQLLGDEVAHRISRAKKTDAFLRYRRRRAIVCSRPQDSECAAAQQ